MMSKFGSEVKGAGADGRVGGGKCTGVSSRRPSMLLGFRGGGRDGLEDDAIGGLG
jgi:hypothetical protein